MGKRPPTYTFQRPRKRQPPPIPVANPQAEMYTVIDDSESSIDQTARYTRYTFLFWVLVIFVIAGVRHLLHPAQGITGEGEGLSENRRV